MISRNLFKEAEVVLNFSKQGFPLRGGGTQYFGGHSPPGVDSPPLLGIFSRCAGNLHAYNCLCYVNFFCQELKNIIPSCMTPHINNI